MDWLLRLFEENGGLMASVLLGAVAVIAWVAFLDRTRSSHSRPGDDEERRRGG